MQKEVNKLKRKMSIALAWTTMILISMLFSSFPLVSAAYTVTEHYMPPEPDDLQVLCAMQVWCAAECFYIPNMRAEFIKVEFWYRNSSAVGDRTGGTSPYPSISHWVDGKVNTYDLTFLTGRYQSTEGDSNWDYMADAAVYYPSARKVDIYDCVKVSTNYGKQDDGSWYQYLLANIVVHFDTGEVLTPDANGFVLIPGSATSFVVSSTQYPQIGAMVTFWGPRKLPIAYSTTFDFKVPDYTGEDVDKEVWYYVLAKFYVPSELSRQTFYFVATADYCVKNVKINGLSKSGGGSSVSINLGKLSNGYHLLEFEFVDISGGGSLNFRVVTATWQYAWLVRFRIYVPNYSDKEYRYNVSTILNLPLDDYYFLSGYADDYINDVYWGGLKMRDWQWSLGSEKIYAWGDGFLYPLVWPAHGFQPFSLTFGEIWGGGLLDFQVVSWSFQRDRLGPPKFYASADLSEGKYSIFPWDPEPEPYCNVTEAKLFGGSLWVSEESPEISNKYFETRLRINATSEDEFHDYLDVSAEVGLGLGWVEWVLGPGTQADDIGILVNLTCVNLHSNFFSDSRPWDLILYNATLDIHSFSALDITKVEYYNEGESRVNQDLTIAVDYLGTVIMFIFGPLAPELGLMHATIGSLVGFGIKGIAAGAKYYQGQQLPPYTKTVQQSHHYQLWYNGNAWLWYLGVYDVLHAPPTLLTTNDMTFFQLKPNEGLRCGLTKVKFSGTLLARYFGLITFPIADIEIALSIPWFIRG